MTVLEDLYNGNISPCDLEHLTDRTEYSVAAKSVSEAREALDGALTAEQQPLLENYITKWDELSLIVEEEIFKTGFSLAIKIMTEVYNKGE